jgi:imidazolonepropionase-like amidohydrolase
VKRRFALLRPVSALGVLALAVVTPAHAQNFALTADHLYTMDAGPQGGPGMVLIRDGKIEEVRTGAGIEAPTGYQAIHGAYVTPGLIDAYT